MDLRLVVAISGPARAGKDTAAEMLSKHVLQRYDLVGRVVRFADPLKQELSDRFGIPLHEMYDDARKRHWGPLMQEYGTAYRRQGPASAGCYPDYWIDKMVAHLTDLPEDVKAAYVPDTRFDNEAVALRVFCSLNAIVFKSLQVKPTNFNPDTKRVGHVSEAGLSASEVTDCVFSDHAAGLVRYEAELLQKLDVWHEELSDASKR